MMAITTNSSMSVKAVRRCIRAGLSESRSAGVSNVLASGYA
jgi:hypothetical protein